MATKSEQLSITITSGSQTLEQFSVNPSQTVDTAGLVKRVYSLGASATQAIALADGDALIIYAMTITGTVTIEKTGGSELVSKLLQGDIFRVRSDATPLSFDVITAAASSAELVVFIIPEGA